MAAAGVVDPHKNLSFSWCNLPNRENSPLNQQVSCLRASTANRESVESPVDDTIERLAQRLLAPSTQLSTSPRNSPVSLAQTIRRELEKATTQEQASRIYHGVRAQWAELQNSRNSEPDLEALNLYYPTIDVLGIGTLSILAEDLSKRIPTVNCYVCHDLETFKASLEVLKSSTFRGKIAFLVRSLQFDDMTRLAAHITPVLIDVGDDKTRMVLMDSVGAEEEERRVLPKGKTEKFQEKYRFFEQEIIQKKNEEFRSCTYMNLYIMINAAKIPNVEIFISVPKRQKDDITCPIFSFNDVKHFFSNKAFFDEISNYGQLQPVEEDDSLFYVNLLPPEHMRLTQSRKKLSEYLRTSPIQRVGGWSLEASIGKLCRSASPDSVGDVQNTKAIDSHYVSLSEIMDKVRSLRFEELQQAAFSWDARRLTIVKPDPNSSSDSD